MNTFLELEKDTTEVRALVGNTILDEYDLEGKLRVVTLAFNNMTNVGNLIDTRENSLKQINIKLNKYEIALHEKYVLAFACFILFFVGAPLGAIIRKGGMGLPMVIAILLFLTYHFIGIFAKNSAEDGSISPFIATWLSTIIMLPLGVYFTYRATTDQGLFSIGTFFHPVVAFFKKNFSKKQVQD